MALPCDGLFNLKCDVLPGVGATQAGADDLLEKAEDGFFFSVILPVTTFVHFEAVRESPMRN